MEEIDILKFLIGIALLSYAAYKDLKYREAENWIWLAIAIPGIFFIFLNLDKILLSAISIAISIIIAFFLYAFGMGGADAKAIMAISILNPLPPALSIFHSPQFVFPLTVLINSLLLIIPLPIAFFIYNVMKKNIEFPYCFFGYKIKAENAKNKFVWPMEKNGKKSIFPIKDFDFSSCKGEIWVTPKLPFLIFIAIGYTISYLIGDVLFLFFSK